MTGIQDLPVFAAIDSAVISLSSQQRPDETLSDLIELAGRHSAALRELEEIGTSFQAPVKSGLRDPSSAFTARVNARSAD